MKKTLFAFFGLLAVVQSMPAVSITLTYQDPLDTFFNAQAQFTLQKAADDVSAAITSSLAALNQDIYIGTNLTTTATVDWNLTYTDPNDGTTKITLNTFNFLADEVNLFVGRRTLGGSTLGRGGPGGAEFGLSGANIVAAQWPGAISAMESASNAGMSRGGPAVKTISGNFPFGGTDGFYDLNYGYAVSTISFDDTSPWNFDYNTLPGMGENDFYSVALHEILHSVGFGFGETFENEVSGTNWNGLAVAGLLGSGVDVLDVDQAHIKEGLTGNPYIDGVFNMGINQEALMDPTLTVGTRKYITNLDLAFIQDMGWQVVPEPSAALLLGVSTFLFVMRRRGRDSGNSRV